MIDIIALILGGLGAILSGFGLGFIFGHKTSADRWIEYQEYRLWKDNATWIGLTPEEIDDIIADAIDPMDALIQTMDKLKEKNSNQNAGHIS
jgi:hypothetical protein